MYNKWVKFGLKFHTVWKKMSENLRGGFFWLTLYNNNVTDYGDDDYHYYYYYYLSSINVFPICQQNRHLITPQSRKWLSRVRNVWMRVDLRVPDDELWAVLRSTCNNVYTVWTPRKVWHATLMTFKRPPQSHLTCVLNTHICIHVCTIFMVW